MDVSSLYPALHVVVPGHSQAQLAGLQLKPGLQPPQSGAQTQVQVSVSPTRGVWQPSEAGSHSHRQLAGSTFRCVPQLRLVSHAQEQLAVSQV